MGFGGGGVEGEVGVFFFGLGKPAAASAGVMACGRHSGRLTSPPTSADTLPSLNNATEDGSVSARDDRHRFAAHDTVRGSKHYLDFLVTRMTREGH